MLCNLIHHLALYQVSVRRLERFATPFPPLFPLLQTACGSLHLAVTTRDRTFTCEISVMPDTHKEDPGILKKDCRIFSFILIFCVFTCVKATPHKDRLSALHAIFRQIFRHFRQNLLEIRQYSCVDFVNLTKNYARNLTRNLCAVLP